MLNFIRRRLRRRAPIVIFVPSPSDRAFLAAVAAEAVRDYR